MCNTYLKNLFQEAINHCRHKTKLFQILNDINIKTYENKTFEEIIIDINNKCIHINGLGLLTIYDITIAICNYYKVIIDKVYIIGGGPKRAIKLLKIKTQKHIISNNLKINYSNIPTIINAFDENKFEIKDIIRYNKNGDILETYICDWQKTQ
jgi:hypothetical protein